MVITEQTFEVYSIIFNPTENQAVTKQLKKYNWRLLETAYRELFKMKGLDNFSLKIYFFPEKKLAQQFAFDYYLPKIEDSSFFFAPQLAYNQHKEKIQKDFRKASIQNIENFIKEFHQFNLDRIEEFTHLFETQQKSFESWQNKEANDRISHEDWEGTTQEDIIKIMNAIKNSGASQGSQDYLLEIIDENLKNKIFEYANIRVTVDNLLVYEIDSEITLAEIDLEKPQWKALYFYFFYKISLFRKVICKMTLIL